MNFLVKLKTYIISLKLQRKKAIELLLVLFFVGILLMLGGKELIVREDAGDKDDNSGNNSLALDEKNLSQDAVLELKISKILSCVKGAGKVEVMVTYDTGPERIYAYETKSNQREQKKEETRESDQESRLAFEEDTSGGKKPVLQKEVHPVPKGAIVIAEGAGSEVVRRNLQEALTVLLKIPQYRVQVFEKNKK